MHLIFIYLIFYILETTLVCEHTVISQIWKYLRVYWTVKCAFTNSKINGNALCIDRVDNIQVVSLIEAFTHQARTDFLVSKRKKRKKKVGRKGKRNTSTNLKWPAILLQVPRCSISFRITLLPSSISFAPLIQLNYNSHLSDASN